MGRGGENVSAQQGSTHSTQAVGQQHGHDFALWEPPPLSAPAGWVDWGRRGTSVGPPPASRAPGTEHPRPLLSEEYLKYSVLCYHEMHRFA